MHERERIDTIELSTNKTRRFLSRVADDEKALALTVYEKGDQKSLEEKAGSDEMKG